MSNLWVSKVAYIIVLQLTEAYHAEAGRRFGEGKLMQII